MTTLSRLVLPLALTALLASPVLANRSVEQVLAAGSTPEEQGLEIAREADARDLGFGDFTASYQMILKDSNGRETVREGRSMTLEAPDGSVGDKSMIVFVSPGDIAGTVTLTHSAILDPDDQWIYLPDLKRVKRISSSNKSGAFVGSEFAFEDLASQEVGKYSYKHIGIEPCGDVAPDRECFHGERFPLYENSGYSKQETWIDTTDFVIRRIDFYDRKGSLLKTLRFTDYEQYLGQYWRAGTMTMTNHQNGRSTILRWNDYKFRTGLADGDFVRDKMTRVR